MIPVFANAGAVWPVPVSGGGGAYSGPGDVVGGALGWWGTRAYSSAAIGSNAVRLRESGGNTEQDFASISGGGLDLSAISSFKGANNLFVVTMYDQVSTNHLTQATQANQPAFTLSGLGSLPIVTFNSTSHILVTGSTITQSQPFTFSTVANRISNTGFAVIIKSDLEGGWTNNNNEFYIFFSGSVPTATVSETTFHALQLVYNNTTSDINVDGSANSVNLGSSNGIAGTTLKMGATSSGSGGLNGNILELGFWGSAFTGTQSSNMSSNQHAYYGF